MADQRASERSRKRPRHESRSRSRSPRRIDAAERETRRHHRRRDKSNVAERLPFNNAHLRRHDLNDYKALFAEYLDVQKQLDIHSLGQHELQGRWKSFLGKWNRGELAEGWYEPALKARIDARWEDAPPGDHRDSVTPHVDHVVEHVGHIRVIEKPREDEDDVHDEDDEEDEFGPSLPEVSRQTYKRVGPAIPDLQDLDDRREAIEGDRQAHRDDLRHSRKLDRRLQKERLEELAPRADAGTRERQLEKKHEIAAAHRAFRETRSPGAEEVGERDLMGDDGIESYKSQKRVQEKRKNERDIRREEVLRARAAERQERMAEHRRKEDKTMETLKAIAKQRFG